MNSKELTKSIEYLEKHRRKRISINEFFKHSKLTSMIDNALKYNSNGKEQNMNTKRTRDEIEAMVSEIEPYTLALDLWSKGIIHSPDYSDLEKAEQVIDSLNEKGYWCKIVSPFAPGEKWQAGFSPHGCARFNGIPYYRMAGSSLSDAVMRAALFMLLVQESEKGKE